MKGVIFINSPKLYNPESMFVAHVSSINSKVELFKILCKRLMLPDYFGFNWDALSDCLRDFHWITQQGIVLIHDELPAIDDVTFQTYIHILIDAINDWKEGDEHYFEIVFPKNVESLILKYLKAKL